MIYRNRLYTLIYHRPCRCYEHCSVVGQAFDVGVRVQFDLQLVVVLGFVARPLGRVVPSTAFAWC